MDCNGNIYNIGMGCCEPMLGPIENYYTKPATDRRIQEEISGISAVTIDEVQEMIDEAVSGITVSGVTEEQMNEAIASAKTQIEAEIPIVPTKVSAFENDVPYLTEHQSLSGYATEQWVEDKHYITGVDLSDYALKSEIPIVPTSNTAFTNDAGYLTEHQSLSGYATEAFVSAFTYDKATIDDKIASGGTFDPALYYKKSETSGATEISNALNLKADKTDVIALSGEVQSKAYTSYVNQRLSRKVDNIISTGEVVDVLLTGASSLDNWPLIVGYDYVLIPDNIYNVYGFNPAGTEGVYDFGGVYYGYLYINANYTVSGDQEEYESIDGKFRLPVADIDTTKVNRIYTSPDGVTVTLVKEGNDINATEEIKKISGKQDQLVAGENITISGNVISAQGGGATYTAGTGIDISGDIISTTLPITTGSGQYSVVITTSDNQYKPTATNQYAYAEGISTSAKGMYSHAEGSFATATGTSTHAEGHNTKAYGEYSHAEGNNTTASGAYSHAEGSQTVASGQYSHAEGANTTAATDYSHAEGSYTKANASYSHAEGAGSQANGSYSHAEGYFTKTENTAEHASGQYNVSNKASATFGNSGNTLFSVGNGTGSNARHNAFEIRQNADIYITSGGTDILLQNNLASSTEKTTWNAKANVWCGSEADWALISGGTLDPQCIYLVY